MGWGELALRGCAPMQQPRGKENVSAESETKGKGAAAEDPTSASEGATAGPSLLDPFDPACPLTDDARRRMLDEHNKWLKSVGGLNPELRKKLADIQMSRFRPARPAPKTG